MLTAPWSRGGSAAAIGTAGHHGRGTSPLWLPLYGRYSTSFIYDTGEWCLFGSTAAVARQRSCYYCGRNCRFLIRGIQLRFMEGHSAR
ncbi:hypothetical protein FKM82_020254 [Ascaphus truei]